jgi:hypothetical protein
MRHGLTALTGFLLFATSATVKAVPINYDEAESGDLAFDALTVPPLFQFDLGNNQFRGTFVNNTNDGQLVADFDAIRFRLPSDSYLQAIRVEVRRTDDVTLYDLAIEWTLAYSFDPYLPYAWQSVVTPTRNTSILEAYLPLGSEAFAGTDLFFGNTAFGYDPGIPDSENMPIFSGSYRISFLVTSGTSVPEPGALALFGVGLAGLAMRRRRKSD